MDFELKDMEEGEVDEDPSKPWRGSDSETGLTNGMQATEKAEQDRRYSTKRSTQDESHLKVRMMELGQAVDAGLKKPPRPRRLHPYVRGASSLLRAER